VKLKLPAKIQTISLNYTNADIMVPTSAVATLVRRHTGGANRYSIAIFFVDLRRNKTSYKLQYYQFNFFERYTNPNAMKKKKKIEVSYEYTESKKVREGHF